jgi:hypothetical protein
MPTLAGAFVQVLIGNAAGTLVDISAYLTSVDPQRASAPTDLSTFAAGGGPISATLVRGPALSEFTLKGLYDPAFAKIVRQIMAARGGFTLQVKSGSNVAPTQGDVLFSGTYTCLQYKLIYNAGITATLEVEVKPCDGGAITPAFGTI